MTYLTRCRRAALQRLRTVRPTVADRRLQSLKRLMQIGRSSSKYPPAKSDFALRRAARVIFATKFLRLCAQPGVLPPRADIRRALEGSIGKPSHLPNEQAAPRPAAVESTGRDLSPGRMAIA